jgi:hypothetical protein
MAKRGKKEFVVGYEGERQCVYGPDVRISNTCPTTVATYVDRMTLAQAERKLETFNRQHTRVIYRLVPFKVVKPSKRGGGE